MFQGLTGTLPFKASSLEDLRNMHVTQEPPLLCELMPSLREDVVAQQIMNKALAKDPEERYQTMKEFHNAIKGWSPNSDDAEIANWAKNATPKPPTACDVGSTCDCSTCVTPTNAITGSATKLTSSR